MNEIYLPPNTKSLATMSEAQIRLGLQGPFKSGKTWDALTFPHPIVMNLDRGLGAHVGRDDVHELPFYNPQFVDSIVRRSGAQAPPNRRDAVLKWLMTEGMKLTPAQTLVVDGQTGLQNAFEAEYNVAPVMTKQGNIDDFAVWRMKVEYFGEICEALKALHCHVVYICHETPDRDAKGNLNGGVRPLLTGQFADQLGSHFTDWFRKITYSKPVTPEQTAKTKSFFGIDDATLKEWCDNSSTATLYVWQTMSDELCKCGTSSLVNCPKYILAHYSSFVKYKRKII